MSYIKDKVQCSCCGQLMEYAWLYPDNKFEAVPTDITIANHDSMGDRYVVMIKCNKCNTITTVDYSRNGKRK